MARSKVKRTKLLSHTRPPVPTAASTNRSSKATRSTIRSYHTLQKRLLLALSNGDTALAESLQSELSANGGLEAYQAASTLGQSAERGGDTSKLLVEWLAPILRGYRWRDDGDESEPNMLRILEVGALSTTNAINIPGKTTVRRIDLRSNAPEIEEQDFMTLPTDQPWQGSTTYDVISLSLVVNFVADAKGRGAMLERTTEFLATNTSSEGQEGLLPALFLVLPLPCVDNSRYLDEGRLKSIMEILGYHERHVKKTNKLYYSLWQFDATNPMIHQGTDLSKKIELRSGRDRNNFCITIG